MVNLQLVISLMLFSLCVATGAEDIGATVEAEPGTMTQTLLQETRAAAEDVEAKTTTAKPEATTTKPDTATYSPTVEISSLNGKNYSFIEHTSFKSSLNGWDFEGMWNKFNLRDTKAPPVPLPRPNVARDRKSGRVRRQVEGGGTPGSAAGGGGTGGETASATSPTGVLGPDDNNFVVVSYVTSVAGVFSKAFEHLISGEIFLNYYILLDDVTLTVTLVPTKGSKRLLLSTSGPRRRWHAVSLPFTADMTQGQRFRLELKVEKTLASGEKVEPKRVFALHHVAVGAVLDPKWVPLPPSPTPSTNATLFPPGSLQPIEAIASRVWMALYVFMAFFVAAGAALVAVVVRARLRPKATRSVPNDYSENTSYRLDRMRDTDGPDRVYDNQGYSSNVA